ncbi:MAG: hydrogenase maturation protease [Deltaproteobacteria bacterium]|nr:MAG: hydrogenase maturation protease [Deltaproteobacteria bacterium]
MGPPGRIVVLGVGNLLLSDEGAGVRCVERLAASGALPAGVVAIDGGTSTHELLGDLEDLDLLVIIDAVASGGAPGSLVRAPGRVVVHGVVPARIALDLALSPEVAAVLPELAARVVAEVTCALPGACCEA